MRSFAEVSRRDCCWDYLSLHTFSHAMDRACGNKKAVVNFIARFQELLRSDYHYARMLVRRKRDGYPAATKSELNPWQQTRQSANLYGRQGNLSQKRPKI
jgi:hypothetical protein